ncbi:MAG: O-antigen ligase family protein [Bacteroidota bacterium]|nr:O-antigen ligase family protein [Bacteroidota bacterium]
MIAKTNHTHLPVIFLSGLFFLGLLSAVWSGVYYLAAIPFVLLFFCAGWKYIHTVFFLLACSLPFSAELRVTATLGTDFPDELLMLFTAGLFFYYWLYSPGILTGKTIKHPLILLLFITLTWSVVSALFSTDHLVSAKFLLAKCWYLGAFVLAPLIIFKEKKAIKITAMAIAVAMLAVTLITLFRHFRYSFSFANINDALQPFFRNHVSYSAMLVCMIPVFFACYKLSRPGITRNIIGSSILVLLPALFLSYSRGAWLALVAGIFSWWLIKNKLLLTGYVAAIIIVLATLFWLKTGDRYLEYAPDYRSTIFHEDFREHLAATYQFRDLSTAERFYRWVAGVRMIKDNPLTGYGPNTFYYNYKPYAVPAFKTYVSDNKEHSTVHNYFLLVAIEQGIPGLVFFLFLVGTMLYYAQHLYHRSKDDFYKIVSITSGVMIMMILTVNFLSDLIETDKIGSLFFLCLSVLIVTDINTKQESSSIR